MVYNLHGLINSLKIICTLIYKIPPDLPFPKGGIQPLFGKEGYGEIFKKYLINNPAAETAGYQS